MDQLFVSILILLHLVLVAGFLLSILAGVFENRNQGNCHFRSKRFIVVVVALLVTNIFIALATIPGIKILVLNSSHTAEVTVKKDRATADNALENLSVMFPDILNDKTKECYRAALSNYVEDDWNKSFNTAMWQSQEPFCKSNPTICNGKQDDYFEAIRSKINPSHLLMHDIGVIGSFLETDWITAAESYKKLYQFTQRPNSKGNVQPPPDERMVDNYQNYLKNCSSLTALPWAKPDKQLLKSDAVFCIGRCE